MARLYLRSIFFACLLLAAFHSDASSVWSRHSDTANTIEAHLTPSTNSPFHLLKVFAPLLAVEESEDEELEHTKESETAFSLYDSTLNNTLQFTPISRGIFSSNLILGSTPLHIRISVFLI